MNVVYALCSFGFRLHQFSSSFVISFVLKVLNITFTESSMSSEDSPLVIAINRLASLEKGIERRYLKHPLRNE